MSWSTSFTGQTSIFNTSQTIGVHTSSYLPPTTSTATVKKQTTNQAKTIDFLTLSTTNGLKTFFLSPGTESYVASCFSPLFLQSPEKRAGYRFVYKLDAGIHDAKSSDVNARVNKVCSDFGLDYIDLILLPYPKTIDPIDRISRTKHNKQMRATWDILSAILTQPTKSIITYLGFFNLSIPQIQSLLHPSLPQTPPQVQPTANYFDLSVEEKQEKLVKFCWGRGIECLCGLTWDFGDSISDNDNGADRSGDDNNTKISFICTELEKTKLEVMTQWALRCGMVVFPDLSHMTASTSTKTIKTEIVKTSEFNGSESKGSKSKGSEYNDFRVAVQADLNKLSFMLTSLFAQTNRLISNSSNSNPSSFSHKNGSFYLNEANMIFLNKIDHEFEDLYNDVGRNKVDGDFVFVKHDGNKSVEHKKSDPKVESIGVQVKREVTRNVDTSSPILVLAEEDGDSNKVELVMRKLEIINGYSESDEVVI